MKTASYVLITPARNEAGYIGALINSILLQTSLPMRWVIINDGSTDQTGPIVQQYANLHKFILPLNIDGSKKRSFGSKARAFFCGYERIKELDFDFIGNLDADVTLQPDYYEQVLMRMHDNARLGTAGGVIWDKTGESFKRSISNPIHTPGAVLFFRRKCFEELGGYPVVSAGGEDSIAILTARMNGWETRAFDDLPIHHHKTADSSAEDSFRRCFQDGLTEYHVGTHPLFAIAKAIRRMTEKPYMLGSVLRLMGYFRLWFVSARRDATPELVRYVAKEQMTRLKDFMRKGTL